MKTEKVKFPLSRKIACMATTLALFVSLVMIVFNYQNYKTEMLEHYEHDAVRIGSGIAARLDPDRIIHYLETGETDDALERLSNALDGIRENSDAEYIYIVRPEADGLRYVMAAFPPEKTIQRGDFEPYEGELKTETLKLTQGEAIMPILTRDEKDWLMSVYSPVSVPDGQSALYVGVGILLNEVAEDLHSFTKRMFVLMTIITVLIAQLDYFVTKRTLADPITRLADAAGQLVEQEQPGTNTGTEIFEKLNVRSHDEVGALYRSLTQMERDMNTYIRDLVTMTAEKEHLGAELSIAARIQADMLPRTFPPFPERHDFDIYATMNPAKEVGGDFYDFFLIDDDHLGLVIADVSGKGVPAALFMANARTLIKNRAMMGGSPSEILQFANEQLCEGNESELFVTVWLAIVELSTGKGLASNAGHEHPALRRGDGKYELVVYRHSPAVATMEGLCFLEHGFELYPGDTLFVYTDGVTEATNARNELFGTDRMLEALNRCPDAEPKTLLHALKTEIDSFVGTAPQFDDITMMCLHYTGSEAKK